MRNLLHHSMKLMASYIFHLPRKGICTMISIYQQTLSPDHGPLKHLYPYGYCRHEPTCSDYGKQNIMKRGVIIGGILLTARLLTCHPWKKPNDKKILKALHRHHWNQYPVSTFFLIQILILNPICGRRIVAITPAFQAGDGGSIPLARSK